MILATILVHAAATALWCQTAQNATLMVTATLIHDAKMATCQTYSSVNQLTMSHTLPAITRQNS